MRNIWISFFIIINLAIPIISVEALTTWIIGIASSCAVYRVSRRRYLSTGRKICYSVIISLIAWGCYYIFYLIARPLGFPGGFIPFI